MAVAARPGPSDARVPCPLCGGLIHPIAGKCKHCKADLSTYHAARPAANAPLPALFRAPPVNDAPRVHAPVAHAIPIGAPYAAPILPPRPTTRAAAPEASGWRSWPILVILIATVAIVIAAVLMVWPSSHDDAGKRVVQPPAPDRMDTQNPGAAAPKPRAPASPPGASIDPWRQAQPTPAPSADPDDDHDLDSMADPFATPHGGPAPRGRRKLAVNGRGMVMFAMADHLCRKMVQCGNDDSTMAKVCDSVSTNATDLPANCPAAERCLQHIDAMACSAQGDDLSQLSKLLSQFRDCADAVRC